MSAGVRRGVRAARHRARWTAEAAAGDRALRAAILRWYRRSRRDLPWRRTRDPYAIWVSEIMLQQTRVETVIPFYERFLARFPTILALAEAPEADVLASWSGLGYYRRARHLREAAGIVGREHAGRLPRDPERLRDLPGIGSYTAAAIASVAFDRPAAAVDGNVIRVLARLSGLRGGRSSSALRREVEARAVALAQGSSPGDWTQALMELGALVCTPRQPRCDECPAAAGCLARASGNPTLYPSAAATAPVRAERRVLLLARRGLRIFLVPREAEAGWTLPAAPVAPGMAAGAARGAALALAGRITGTESARGPIAAFRHRTYAEDLTFELWEADAPAKGCRGRWVAPDELSTLPLRAPTLKALKRLRILS